jgi:hypothetical protein
LPFHISITHEKTIIEKGEPQLSHSYIAPAKHLAMLLRGTETSTLRKVALLRGIERLAKHKEDVLLPRRRIAEHGALLLFHDVGYAVINTSIK